MRYIGSSAALVTVAAATSQFTILKMRRKWSHRSDDRGGGPAAGGGGAKPLHVNTVFVGLGLLLTTGFIASCRLGSGPGEGTSDAGVGGCPSGPVALFSLRVTAADGQALPCDTTLKVSWSAEDYPPFVLCDPSSVGDGDNVVCEVDWDAALPLELDELRCELWTGGTTDIELSAPGYVTDERTLMPAEREGCEGYVPSTAHVELQPDVDAGQ